MFVQNVTPSTQASKKLLTQEDVLSASVSVSVTAAADTKFSVPGITCRAPGVSPPIIVTHPAPLATFAVQVLD